jgi:hypothetical protein
VFNRDLDDLSEILIAMLGANVTRIDPQLRESTRSFWEFLEQEMPVVMEIANNWRWVPRFTKLAHNLWNRTRRAIIIDRNSDEFTACVN